MITLSQIKPFLLYKFTSESQLIESIEEVSRKFTVNRDLISDYIKDSRLVSAYACFYLMTNLPKLEEVLRKIHLPQDELSDYEFIDIGCGPGTFTLSLLNMNKDLDIYALEKSELMIDQARKLINSLYPAANVSIFDTYKRIPKKKKKRLGIFGHSANEMPLEFIENLVSSLELDDVLFVEPGTKDYFRKSLKIRNSLLNMEYSIKFPCPCQSTCPMGKEDWCHQYIKVNHEAEVERLTQLVSKDRRLLPLTIHYFSRDDVKNEQVNRLVRVYKPTKFSIEWQLCRNTDGENTLIDLQVMNKGYSKPFVKELKKKLAGENIDFIAEKEMSTTKIRGRVSESREC